MADKEIKVVEVQEKLKDITECPICKETYKEPKILPCIHTFCMLCLQESGLKTNKSPGEKMPCPICRTEFKVPENGFVGLEKNFFIERLIEMNHILNPSPTHILCDACQEDNDAVSEVEIPSADMYFVDCNQRLCAECCRHHRKYKATKDHRMVSLEDGQIHIPSNVKSDICDKHQNKPLEMYCSSCQEAVCALCFFESHKIHETSPLINVVTDFRRIIHENADNMMSHVLDLKQKQTGEDKNKAAFARKVTDVESEIRRTRQRLKRCIDKVCDSLLQQLNSIKEEKLKENQSKLYDIETVLASLESFQAYCTQITTIGSEVDICRAVHSLNARATELQQRYKSVALEPFPDIWLKKTEFYDTLCQSGNNIIGKIAENGDKTHGDKKSFTGTISSFVDELNVILDTTYVKEMEGAMMSDRELANEMQKIKTKIHNIVETNAKLRSELDLQRECVKRLNRDTDLIRMDRMQSSVEVIDLKKQVALLKSIAYDGDKTTQEKKSLQYKKGLTFRQTIKTVAPCNDATFRVTGVAILDNELFISSNSNVVEVNDLRTLNFKRRLRAEQMAKIIDIKSCIRKKYLYILGRNTVIRSDIEFYILRFDERGKQVAKWKVNAANMNTEISVTDESNVLLTIQTWSKLIEYSPNGKLIREIPLKWESGIHNPMHAIKLTSDHFVVCHGKEEDSLHRVCIVDFEGNVLNYFGELRRTDILNNPIYLERTADGNILVADHLNLHVLLLSSSLKLIQELSTHDLKNPYNRVIEHRPRKMILDEANGRMFVVENVWKSRSRDDWKQHSGDELSVYAFSLV